MRFLWLVALAACHAPETGSPRPPPPAKLAVRPGLVHGADIATLAVTEDGSAALTVDGLGDVRLWPALDGSRPPVPIQVRPPVEVALARRRDGWLGATIDQSGGLELLAFSPDGGLRARAEVPSDVAYVELAVFGAHTLARRADQRLVAIDDRGAIVGELSPGHGERIAGLAARHGAVIAAIQTGDDGIAELRWVEAAPLRWGATIALPERIELPIALSPGHRRFAARTHDHYHVHVFELSATAALIPDDDTAPMRPDVTALGFVSDDRVGILGPTLWWVLGADHRGRVGAAGIPFLEDGEFIDGRVVGGNGPSLLVADPDLHVRYVGYRDIPTTMSLHAGDRSLMVDAYSDGRNIWLDDALREVRSFEVKEVSGMNAYAIDERHVIVARSTDNKRGMTYELVDLARPHAHVTLGSFDDVNTAYFDHDRRELLISIGTNTIARIHLDASLRADRPPELEASSRVVLFDPARAGGLVAMDTDYKQRVTLVFFRAGHAAAATRLAPSSTLVVPANVVAHDLAGTVYLQDTGDATRIIVVEGGKIARRFTVDAGPETNTAHGATTHDAKLVALSAGVRIVAIDPEGHERWHVPMQHVDDLTFTADDRALIVTTRAGIVKLDAATGAELATACAWEFGSYDLPLAQSSFGERPVCEPRL